MRNVTENREKFIKRLAGLKPQELFLVELAYDIAKEGHGYLNQERDGGERYFEHVRSVALILIDEFGVTDYVAICLALLHDIPEDTYIWRVPGRLTHIFGKDIGTGAHMLSKLPKESYSSKEEQLAQYFGSMLETKIWQVLAVKVADRIHNLRTMNEVWDDDKKERYRNEAREYFFDLTKALIRFDPILGNDLNNILENEIHKSYEIVKN
ncbi:MAG: HD domain-containing protein [Candidatus Pacebacteria bacterium]|nr:HD domain-containing protein [Candidatus Paceibacterota bacterium]